MRGKKAMLGEVPLVAAIVDQLQRVLLEDKRAVNDVPHRPILRAIGAIPLPLASGALPLPARPADLPLDDVPRHAHGSFTELA